VRAARALRVAEPAAGGTGARPRRGRGGAAARAAAVGGDLAAAVPAAVAGADLPLVGGPARSRADRARDDPALAGRAWCATARRRRVRAGHRAHAAAGSDA